MDDLKVDSKDGIEALLRWARANGFVLDAWHKRLAVKYGVPIEGVTFAEQIPTS